MKRAILSVLLAIGCHAPKLKSYTPVTMSTSLPPGAVHEAVRSTVKAWGWTIVVEDREMGTIVAETPIDVVEATETRERWTFVTTGGALSIERVFEARFDPTDDWMSAPIVCATYAYAREREIAARLTHELGAVAFLNLP